MSEAAIFALRPRWVEAILGGSKTVEVRRRPIGIGEGCLAVLYATAPLGQVLGSCRVEAVHRGPAESMWRRFGARTGLGRLDFMAYLDGSDATCIELDAPRAVGPISLAFPPPQSWMRLQPGCEAHLELLCALGWAPAGEGGER